MPETQKTKSIEEFWFNTTLATETNWSPVFRLWIFLFYNRFLFLSIFEPKNTKWVFYSGIPLGRLFWVWAGWVGKIDTVRVRSFSVVHPLPNFLDNSLQTFYETKHNRPEIIVQIPFELCWAKRGSCPLSFQLRMRQ